MLQQQLLPEPVPSISGPNCRFLWLPAALNAFGPKVGHKAVHPETRDVTLSCAGSNDKNAYDRQTPCDQDFLRKFARSTMPEKLQRWFNHDVMEIFKQHKAFDADGIFLGDANCPFVPDNERYEGSVRMLFDEHNQPADKESQKSLTVAQRARCRWRRCSKLVSLIHTNVAGDFFLYAAVAVVSGKAHECPVLFRLVDDFVAAVGPGVMKRLILDRGFLDGEQIGRCKTEYGIDILIPLKKNMGIYADAAGLMRGKQAHFEAYQAPAPKPPEQARKKVRAKTQQLEGELAQELALVRNL